MFAIMVFSLPSCEKSNDNPFITTQENEAEYKSGNTKARPYKGSVDYVVDQSISLTCSCEDPYFIGNYFKGTGNITHMGNVTSESIPCITYTIQEGIIVGYEVISQCSSLIAANGDELWYETAPYTMNLDFDCFCAYTGTATTTFTGGTGRFENASGSASVIVVNDLLTGIVTATFDGEIIY